MLTYTLTGPSQAFVGRSYTVTITAGAGTFDGVTTFTLSTPDNISIGSVTLTPAVTDVTANTTIIVNAISADQQVVVINVTSDPPGVYTDPAGLSITCTTAATTYTVSPATPELVGNSYALVLTAEAGTRFDGTTVFTPHSLNGGAFDNPTMTPAEFDGSVTFHFTPDTAGADTLSATTNNLIDPAGGAIVVDAILTSYTMTMIPAAPTVGVLATIRLTAAGGVFDGMTSINLTDTAGALNGGTASADNLIPPVFATIANYTLYKALVAGNDTITAAYTGSGVTDPSPLVITARASFRPPSRIGLASKIGFGF